MPNTDVDVVVVGAGIAGLCCAAHLLEQGVSTTLVCETPEVGWALRSAQLGKSSKGFVQHPIYAPGLNGGSWFSAARIVNAPVSFHISPPMHILNKATGARAELKACPSASSVLNALAPLVPFPIDAQRPDLERVLNICLRMSWDELAELQRTPLAAWVGEQGGDEILTMIMCVLAANLAETTPQIAAEHVSVYGMMGMLRGLVCGEAVVTAPSPDPWEGLCVPLGKGLEANGVEVRRGAKVAKVIVEDGRAVGVALQNGDEIRARAVALAVGNPRVPALLETIPDEVSGALDYAAQLLGHDACTYSLLDKDVVPIRNMTMVADEMGSNLAYLFPMNYIAPDSTEDGKWLLAAQAQFSKEAYQEIGGNEGAIKHLLAVQEEMFPGFEDATVERKTMTHKHHWLNPLTHGPKLPGQSSDIPGLYFAGDGSTPIMGIGVEGAGQAGAIRARQIAADLRAS
ncbi:MAG TPA: FAD-dependent oxidoreductase [Pseudonocardia sp.]|nr:FAD-dependent oxidoreductase [Pseudonocardia sp.]